MLKLKGYLKPYILFCVLCICCLFVQVITQLNLPNYLSKIVDEGLQKGGISESAPQAISADGMRLLNIFISDGDKARLEQLYKTAERLETEDRGYYAQIKEKFPDIQPDTLIINKNITQEDMQFAENTFSKSIYSLVLTAQQLMSQQTDAQQTQETDSTDSMSIDTLQLYKMLPVLQALPEQTVSVLMSDAEKESETVVKQASAVFIKGFYKELGADTNRIQMLSILKNGLIMLLFSLLDVSAAIGAGFFASRVGAAFARDLRRDVFKKVSYFSNSSFDSFGTASLITRTTNDITQMQMVVGMGLRMVLFAPIMGIGAVIMALNKSVSMSWIMVLAVIIIIGVISVIGAVAMPKFNIMQKLIDRLNLVTREELSGMMVIRAFGNQDFEEKRFDKANTDLTQNGLFVNRVVGAMFPAMMLVMNGTMLLIVWIGAHQIVSSTLEVGAMMAFMQYAMEVIMSFLMISMMFIMLPRAGVSAERIYEVLKTKETVLDPEKEEDLNFENGCDVEFDHVSFRYKGAEEDVLHDITFTAKAGETTAFIGSTGSGKTTLISLVPRFYDPTEGSIKINGTDIRNITQHTLRDNIGYVPQKSVLFSGDIASNLRYGDENASDEDLLKAAETAQAMEFISEKPDGFETTISQGGTNVSGGQRQRLSIARALTKKAKIYIFDDSFSALDFKTDAALRKALAENVKQSTVLLVAQRISTIMNADKIVVLSEGRIAGMGTHGELMKNCDVYREIALSQLSEEELK